MKKSSPAGIRKWLILPPIVIGAAVVIWFTQHAREPQRRPQQEVARVLRVIEAPPVDVMPRVLGYGTAKPARVWRAVAEVEGRVVKVHSELKAGAFVKKGEVVLEIDPREYELVVSQLEAEIAQNEANLAELETQQQNDRVSLDIEQASLRLAQADLDRVLGLIEQDDAAPSEVRDEQRAYLAQKQKAQALQNALNLVPKKRSQVQATIRVSTARLQQARLNLHKTVIKAPFHCRLAEVQIEKGQFLKAGETLFEADGTEATEVDAQISLDRLRGLLPPELQRELGSIPSMAEIRKLFDIQATVRMHMGDFVATWPARFVRIREQIDPVTRTLAVVIAVDKPYERAIPGQRPPLVKGSYCEVELRGKSLPGRIVIPRVALHEDVVYVVDGANRLARRDVTVLFAQSDFLCIGDGLDAGMRVVVSDPTPAIEGMLVTPVNDEKLTAALIAQAQAGTDVR